MASHRPWNPCSCPRPCPASSCGLLFWASSWRWSITGSIHPTSHPLDSASQPRVVLPTQRTPAMSGDILGRRSLRRWRRYWCLVSRRQGCCYTSSYPWDSPPTTQNYPAPNIQPDSAEVEKPCPRLVALDKPGCPREACAEDGFRLSGK